MGLHFGNEYIKRKLKKMENIQRKQQQAIRYMSERIATLIGTSTVMNDNGVQMMVVVSKGVWDSLAKLVTDENGMVDTGVDPVGRLPQKDIIDSEATDRAPGPVQLELPFGDWEENKTEGKHGE